MNKKKTSSLPPLKASSHHTSNKKIKGKPPTERIGDYIDRSMQYIENGSYQNGKLLIDGNIGDYRMSIFRLKDKKKRINQNPSSFTKTFIKDIEETAPHLKEEFRKIVSAPNQKYLKAASNKQEEEEKYKPLKWQSQQEEHLFYQYVPKYQREKWFVQTVDKSQEYEAPVLEVPVERRVVKKAKKRTSDRKHIFRFLDNYSGML